MRSHIRLISDVVGCVALLFSSAWPLLAEDGPSLYKQLCATCHDTGLGRAPDREALRAMSPERVLAALESGVMLSMAAGRTGVERRTIAEFVTGKPFVQAASTTPSPQAMCRAAESGFANPLAGPLWNGWGMTTANTRYQDRPGFTAAEVPRLQLKWAFGFPGELSSDSQPTVVGGRVFVGTQNGTVYALSAATGCVHWFFQAAAAVRAAISIGRIETRSGPRYAAFIGDRAGNVYGVDAETGERLWNKRVDDFPFARVTGAPVFHNGRLYVGVASGEETAGATADYECCRFRGSLVALNGATGKQVWRTYTIPDAARRMKKNKSGTQWWGPSGAASWTTPAIDPDRKGEILWQTRVGKGGINGGVQWGSAADQSNVYVALSDLGRTAVPYSQATLPDPAAGGGMFAIRLDNGQQVWHTPPPGC